MAFPLQEQYVNLLTDFGFKRVFGSEPNAQLLIDFLNTLLPEHHHIQSLSYKTTENLGNTLVDRKAIFDIYCQGANGDRFIVELQKAKQNFFKDRSIFYASFPIQEQALKGEWNFQLAPVYSIGILDFVFDEPTNRQPKNADFDTVEKTDKDTVIHTVKLKNQHCETFYDKLTFIYIELPKFKKSLEQLDSSQDKWLYLFRHLPTLEGQPRPFQDPIFLQLFEVAQIANFTPEEQTSYQSSLKYYRDLNNVINTSREEGREEGMGLGVEKGRKQGEDAKALEIARALLAEKVPIEIVSKTTGLTVAELNQLSSVD